MSAMSAAAACGNEPSSDAAPTVSPTETPEAADGPTTEGGADASSVDSTAAPLVPLWSKQFGEASAKEIEGAKAVATDPAGNVIVVGEIWGAADFGGGVLATAGGQDIFVAKLDPNGKHLWSRRFGDAGAFQVAQAVAVDAAGNVVFAGSFDGHVDFGGGDLTSAGGTDIFVAKLDSNGKHMWSKRFGDVADGQKARSISVDTAGAVVVAGELAGAADFGGGALTATGGADAFVVKLDASGTHLWSHRYGGDGKTTAAAVRTDGSNNVVIVGDFGFTVDFSGTGGGDAGTGGGEGPVLTSLGGSDAFVTKLDPNGKHLWSKRLGGAAKRQSGDAVAIDAAGNLLVASTFEGTVNFGGDDLVDLGFPTFGMSNVAVVKLTPAGVHVWSKGFGDAARQFIRAVAFDHGGNALLSGQFTGTMNFGGADLTTTAKSLFLVKLDGKGAHVWSKKFGSVGEVETGGVVTDFADSIVLAGRFSGKVDFGAGPHSTADSDYDAVVVKLPPAGQ
ncbi:MAG TPA: hypothetical protein VLT33_08670 [Labilithrix sp.]|nr:hypothetical protein [Labilithrix sp.]